jgi:peptidylamidoglycolate lyase
VDGRADFAQAVANKMRERQSLPGADSGRNTMNTNKGLNGLSLKTIMIAGLVAVSVSACTQKEAVAPTPAPDLTPLSMEKGGMDQTGPYEVVEGWFKPGIDRWDYAPTAVLVDNPERIFVAFAGQHMTQPNSLMHTADGKIMDERSTTSELPASEKKQLHQIVVLNGNGEIIEDWSQWNDVFGHIPHSLAINPYDPERHLWVVDLGHQVFKFTNDGKEMVLHLGEKNESGWSEDRFNMPSSIAFLPDGTFLLADGYVNGRIARFDADGNYISEFGSKGSGPGQFDLVHAITMDDQGRIYAADRRNHRIQVFDKNGNFIEEWPNLGSPTKVRVTEDQKLWVTDAQYTRFAKYDLDGHLLTYWGVQGDDIGEFDNLHSFDVDSSGNLYVGDAWNNRVQKFVPKADTDPLRLIGQQYFLPSH